MTIMTEQYYEPRPSSPEVPQQMNPWDDNAVTNSPTSTMYYSEPTGVEYPDWKYERTAGLDRQETTKETTESEAAETHGVTKSPKELRREKVAAHKTKKRMSKLFGGSCTAPIAVQKPKATKATAVACDYNKAEQSDNEDVANAMLSEIPDKKSSEQLRREKIAAYKTKKRMNQNFGSCHEAPAVPPKPKTAVAAAPWEYKAENSSDAGSASSDDSDSSKKSAKDIRRALIATHKTKKRMDQNFGACHEAPVVQKKSKNPLVRATTTRKNFKKQAPEEFAGMKTELDINRENWAEQQALKIMDYQADLEGEGFQIL